MIKKNELVINFHMTEACNYRCDYCYATWDTGCHSKELHRTEGKGVMVKSGVRASGGFPV